MSKSYALRPVKKITFRVMTAITIILICYVALHVYDRNKNHTDKVIINIFEKQRMYSQTISDEADSLYTLMLETETGQDHRNKKDIENEISSIKNNIQYASKELSQILDSIHTKRIMNSSKIDNSEYLTKIDKIWEKMDSVIKVIIDSKTTNYEMKSAVKYIKNNNIRLLNFTDSLLDQRLEKIIRLDGITEFVEYGLILVLFILLSFYLYHLMHFIILPYNQLYKGITDIGLHSYPENQYFLTRKRVQPLVSEVSSMFLKINNLISLIENINNNKSFMETLSYINETFSVFIPYNYIGIALISEDKKILKASYGVSDSTIIGLPEKIIGVNWPVEDTSLGTLIESGEARFINDLEEYCSKEPPKPYNKIIMEAGIRASITLPLRVSGKPVGVIFFSSKNKNVYNNGHLNILYTLANSIAISLNQNIFTRDMQYSSILALANLSEARDEDTGEHMERMAIYSRTIAQLLHENNIYSEDITLEYIDLIERFSPLHDIGKVGIADSILLKQGKLTEEEFNEMKKHTLYGAQVLESADMNFEKNGNSMFGLGIEIAKGHHEKWNGTGYPYGMKKYDIPLSARIVAIADVFDALTSKRPYKEALSFEISIKMIEEGRDAHFDPTIVDIFIENKKRIQEIYDKFQ